MKRPLPPRWIDAIWCIALSLYILAGTPLVPLHGDESTQIFMGRDFYYHLNGETERVFFADWDSLDGDAGTEQQLRLINGTLPKYLFGLMASVSGYTLDEINQQWAWGLGWDWNHENGHVPSDDLLLRTRLVSALLLSLSAVALFCIGDIIAGRPAAYLASAYYVLNPAILVNGRRAMMEGGMLAFTLMVVMFGLQALQHRHWLYFVMLGIVSGLAVASKHTSVVTVAVVFAASGFYLLTNAEENKQSFTYLIGAGILSLAVFAGLNPAWWQQPVSALRNMLDLRQELLAGQVGFFGGYDGLVNQTMGFIRQGFIVPPMYAETEVDGFIANQMDVIQAYDNSLLSGIAIGGTVFGGIVLGVLVLLGAVYLWQSETIETSSKWMMIVWALAMVGLTLGLTPLEWQRYYLPLYPVIGILASLGIISLWTAVNSWWKTTQTN